MDSYINSNDLIYKNTLSEVNDASKNNSAVRIFRDITTDVYTDTFLKDNDQLNNFLDYTFHLLYSQTIHQINKNIIIYNENNPDSHIKPICGSERVYLIFKGGTLMNNFFLSHVEILKEKHRKISSTDVSNKYDVELSKFNEDLENNTSANTSTDTFDNFSDILKKKFAISDTDYSLVIHTMDHSRFNVIYYFAIKALESAFNILNNNFNEYYNNILNPMNNLNKKNSINNSVSNTMEYKYDENRTLILNELRNIVDSKNIAENIIENIAEHITIALVYIDSKQTEINSCADIYYLYDMVEIVNLLIYIRDLNSPYSFNETILKINLNDIQDKLNSRITSLIEGKLVNLKNGLFYEYDKINTFKKNMLKKYEDIQNDIEANKTFSHPTQSRKINSYILNQNNIYTTDSFQIKPRKSVAILSNTNPIKYNEINETDEKKIHYLSFNSLIRKVRDNGSATDFDLIRTKFNVELSPGIITKIHRRLKSHLNLLMYL